MLNTHTSNTEELYSPPFTIWPKVISGHYLSFSFWVSVRTVFVKNLWCRSEADLWAFRHKMIIYLVCLWNFLIINAFIIHTPGTSRAYRWCGSHCLGPSYDCSLARWARRSQKCSSSLASSLSASWVGPNPLHPGLLPPPHPDHKHLFQSRRSRSRRQRFLGPPGGLCEGMKGQHGRIMFFSWGDVEVQWII